MGVNVGIEDDNMKEEDKKSSMIVDHMATTIALNDAEWAAFMAALDAPTKARPRLDELLTTPSVFECPE